jgi:hypothetical protein
MPPKMSAQDLLPAILYAAKSTDDPRGSIPTQLADCRTAAERAGNRQVVAEHVDEAASAFKGSRGPGLAAAKQAAAQAAARHGAAELWVQHSDRLARGDGLGADHLAEIFFAMRRIGVRLRSVQDDSNLEDAIRAVLIGERNYEDSARKSHATRSGKRRRFDAGKAVGGPVHDGYRLDPVLRDDGAPLVSRDGRVQQDRVVDPDRAPLIARIFDLVEQGHTFGDVQRTLNREGHKTMRGKPWTTRRIRATIHNPYYAGFITAYDERIPGDHEPLIDYERWQRILAGLERADPVAQQARKGGNRPAEDYLLRRVAFCGHCGLPLYTRRMASVPGERAYICRAVRQCEGTCQAPPIPAQLAETQVLEHLDCFIDNVRDWIGKRADSRSHEREEFRRALDQQRAELRKLTVRAQRAHAQHRKLLDSDDDLAPHALRVAIEMDGDRDRLAESIREAEQRLADWPVAPDIDAALDFYNELRDAVQGRVAHARSARELNIALRDTLEGAWLSIEPDGRFVGRFVLRVTDETLTGKLPEELVVGLDLHVGSDSVSCERNTFVYVHPVLSAICA